MEILSKHLIAVANAMGCKFTLRGQPIEHEKVFAQDGLLPGIMRRADQMSTFCLEHNLGLSFDQAAGSLLGIIVNANDKCPHTVRLMCAVDVIHEFMYQASNTKAIALDDLLMD